MGWDRLHDYFVAQAAANAAKYYRAQKAITPGRKLALTAFKKGVFKK